MFSLAAGLISQAVIALYFGASAEMDAYLTALAIPIYLQAILVGGLSFVFIPAFVEHKTREQDEEAWGLVGTFFWLTAIILTALAIAGSLLAPFIISLSAPGLAPDKAQLAAGMLAIVIFVVPLSGLSSLTTGVQNARDNFFWPAIGGAVNSLVSLASLIILYPRLGALALPWGYLMAMIAQASVTVIPVLRHGWPKLISLTDERVQTMARLIVPFILFGVLTKAAPVLQRFFASGLPDGDLSYLGYADKIAHIFNALLGASIATAIFPTMSRAFVKEGKEGLARTLKYGLRLTIAAGLPLVAILSAISIPFVTVLFERGAFDSHTTLQVSRIIPIMLVGSVLFHMTGNLMTRVFYVTKDTRTPPMIAAASSILYIFLAYRLVNLWGYVGLAAAHTLYRGTGVVVLGLLILRRLNYLQPGKLLRNMARYAIPSLMAFGVAWILLYALATLPALIQIMAAGGAAGVLYMLVLSQLDATTAYAILEMSGVTRILQIPPLRRVVNALPNQFRWKVKGRTL